MCFNIFLSSYVLFSSDINAKESKNKNVTNFVGRYQILNIFLCFCTTKPEKRQNFHSVVQWLGNELSQSIETEDAVWVNLCSLVFK